MLTLNRQSIKINRAILLGKLEENLASHEIELKEALIDYEKLVITFAENLIQDVHAGNFDNVRFTVQKPQSFVQRYKDVIDMLKYSVDETIELDAMAFKAYINNEWEWTSSFKTHIGSLKGG